MESIEYLNKLIEDSRNIAKIEKDFDFITYGDYVKVQLSGISIKKWKVGYKLLDEINGYIFKIENKCTSEFFNQFNNGNLTDALDKKNKYFINYRRDDLIKLSKEEVKLYLSTIS